MRDNAIAESAETGALLDGGRGSLVESEAQKGEDGVESQRTQAVEAAQDVRPFLGRVSGGLERRPDVVDVDLHERLGDRLDVAACLGRGLEGLPWRNPQRDAFRADARQPRRAF